MLEGAQPEALAVWGALAHAIRHVHSICCCTEVSDGCKPITPFAKLQEESGSQICNDGRAATVCSSIQQQYFATAASTPWQSQHLNAHPQHSVSPSESVPETAEPATGAGKAELSSPRVDAAASAIDTIQPEAGVAAAALDAQQPESVAAEQQPKLSGSIGRQTSMRLVARRSRLSLCSTGTYSMDEAALQQQADDTGLVASASGIVCAQHDGADKQLAAVPAAAIGHAWLQLELLPAAMSLQAVAQEALMQARLVIATMPDALHHTVCLEQLQCAGIITIATNHSACAPSHSVPCYT